MWKRINEGSNLPNRFSVSGPLMVMGLDASIPAFACLYLLAALPLPWPADRALVASVPSLLLGATLIALSAIDLRSFRLPDRLTLPLLLAGIASSGLSGAGVYWGAASALVGFALLYTVALVYKALRGQDGLGLGDAKLFAASGAWLGADALATVLLYACSAALLSVLVALCLGGPVGRNTRLPFGPFLAFGTWLVWLYG